MNLWTFNRKVQPINAEEAHLIAAISFFLLLPTDNEGKSLDGVRELIRLGNVNVADTLGYTALHWMAIRGNVKSADLLLKNGANVNVVDNLQQTPLQRAVAHDEDRMVDLLIRSGANVNALHGEKR